MKQILPTFLLSVLLVGTSVAQANETTPEIENPTSKDKLVVLWTSDDPYVAERVCLMYTHAAKTQGWFDEVVLVVWGPSAKLISENLKLREKVKTMQKDGVILQACVACANSYGVTEDLKKFGFEVKGMGKPLTDYLKTGAKVLTF
ncbi:DsrE family protein [Marinilabilia salmonicolor]|uniref:Uncharacterized protein n=1 Tax=Marinilabilia salmonicolor TaxID=989 RepID=A0A368VH58_9BACT|nr:DsrE family protein [Marinilabilia salmonicolor]RCW38341.1 hypothetical protein DFO77_10499 [Marinilabilia salmonicolor]